MPVTDQETSFKMMDYYAERGGNFIDTANVYNSGESEEVGAFLSVKTSYFLTQELINCLFISGCMAVCTKTF